MPLHTRIHTIAAILLALTVTNLAYAQAQDCNANGVADAVDIRDGYSTDLQGNGIPDECDPAGDLNGDWEIDILDFFLFGSCITGPCQTPPCDPVLYSESYCPMADFDQQGDVDLDDFASFQRVFPPADNRIIISEFMASNSDDIQDEDGDYSDWIELRNTGHTAVDLAGWHLTDDQEDLTKWTFPSTSIPAGGYIVVFASSKDRATAGQQLHTNFKIGADGEYLGLVRPDGVTVEYEYAPAFPPQMTDASYGLSHSLSNGTLRYFSTPTPGAVNNMGFDGFSDEPLFSHDPGTFVDPFQLTITAAPEAAIRYTTDGSEPTRSHGTVYTGSPITISNTTPLRVRAFEPGYVPSPLISRLFVALHPSMATFNSNLPLIVLDTRGNEIPCIGGACQDSDYILIDSVFIDLGDDQRSHITDPAEYAGRGGIKIRGSTSAGFPKKQYSFEIWDEYNEDMDVSLLGFPSESDWIIHAPYSDKTLMRNFLAYKWSNDIGRWAVGTKLVEVFINEDGGKITQSDYRGVYVFMEKIKQGPDRVDIAKLDPDDNAEPEITGGYIIRKDRMDAGESGFGTQMIGQLAYFDPKEDELTTQQRAWVANYVNEFETVLQSTFFDDPENGYARYIDVDSFIDHHILVEMLKNIDGYRLSTFMHIDRNGKLNMGPIWDYNLSMGNADYIEWNIYTYQMATFWYYEQGFWEHAWYDRLMQDPEYVLRYADRWFQLRRENFSNENLAGDFMQTYTLLTEAAQRNFVRWDILNQWVWPNWYYGTASNPHTYQMEVDWASTWLTGYDLSGNQTPQGDYSNRLAWFDNNIGVAKPPAFSQQGGEVQPGYTLTIEPNPGQSGTVFYTLDGSDPHDTSSYSVTLVTEQQLLTAVVPTESMPGWNTLAYDDSTWTSGIGGVGYETNPSDSVNFTDLINLDVQETMYDLHPSCYIRIPFGISASDLAGLSTLTLNVRYDDAFIAYINGTEVARSPYAPANPFYNASATSYHEDYQAVQFDPYDISSAIGLINDDGNNVLAIQGFNNGSGSSDFLVSAQMTGRGTLAASSLNYSQTGPITITADTQVKARILHNNKWSALNEATFTVGSQPIYINEFMADNDATIEDPDEPGSYEDWIELYNPAPIARDLSGMYLTDDLSDPTQWQIPQGVTIPAGGYLVFWADSDTGQGPTHADFKLSKGGESIGLFDTDANGNTLIDSITFGEQETDISYGRSPDGSNNWQTQTTATPGASN